MRNNILIVK
jgi:hypothetical protein